MLCAVTPFQTFKLWKFEEQHASTNGPLVQPSCQDLGPCVGNPWRYPLVNFHTECALWMAKSQLNLWLYSLYLLVKYYLFGSKMGFCQLSLPYVILLCLTLDDFHFTCQGRDSRREQINCTYLPISLHLTLSFLDQPKP